MATTGKQLIDQVASIKGSRDTIDFEKNKSLVTGAVIGMSAGFFFGYAKHHNMLVCGLLGALGGAIVSRVLIPN